MEFRKVNPLRGPNLWAACPMLEVWLGPEHHADRHTRDIAGFCERWATWLPMMPDPAARDVPDALLAGVMDGFTVADALLRLTLRLQRIVNGRVDPALGFATPADGCVQIALEFEDEALARLCLACAWRMTSAAIDGRCFDTQDEVTRLHLYADDFCLGPSTRAILAAARRRRIPTRRLNQWSLVQLGSGVHQRRILTAETDRTSAIAESIAQDKDLTKKLLAAVGASVPQGRSASSPADAWDAACEVGLPVVVKPRNANHGRGVSINLSTRAQIETAFAHARAEGDGVLVEQFARGAEHRLLVVQGRVVAATRGEPDQVEADGRHTVAELVDVMNKDPRRGRHYAFAFNHVDLDAAAILTLEEQGYQPSSIPPAGATVLIHRNGEMTTDETDEVHPRVAEMAVLAANAIGLDIAGVDMLAPDIGRPLEEQGGVILEVNARPGLLMHLAPQRGQPRAVGEMIVDSMFPPDHPGRVPMVALAGCHDARLAPLVARILQTAGYYVGQAAPGSSMVDARPLAQSRGPLWRRVDELSMHPWMTAMMVEFDAQTLRDEGMPLMYCDVAVIGPAFRTTRAAGDGALGNGALGNGALGEASTSADARPHDNPDLINLDGVKLDAMRRVIAGTFVPTAWVALWLDDPLSAATAAALGTRVIWLAGDEFAGGGLSREGREARLRGVLESGARVVFAANGSIFFGESGQRWPLGVDASQFDRIAARLERNAIIAATAVGWALGVAPETIAAAIGADDESAVAAPSANGAANGYLAHNAQPVRSTTGLSSGA